MFTGIVEEVGKVVLALPDSLAISADEVIRGMKPGQSIGVNGVCLTVTDLSRNSFSAEIMPETLNRTNLGSLAIGDEVNIERPVALGGQLGGHLVQGHVDATGRIVSITGSEEAILIKFEASPEVMRYVVEKGFVAVDGVSLTVATRGVSSFQVSVVGYTRSHTTLGKRRVGDLVNLEVDIIAKYVEQLGSVRRTGITMDFLQEHGFLVS
jgi:riboflavin synthase